MTISQNRKIRSIWQEGVVHSQGTRESKDAQTPSNPGPGVIRLLTLHAMSAGTGMLRPGKDDGKAGGYKLYDFFVATEARRGSS